LGQESPLRSTELINPESITTFSTTYRKEFLLSSIHSQLTFIISLRGVWNGKSIVIRRGWTTKVLLFGACGRTAETKSYQLSCFVWTSKVSFICFLCVFLFFCLLVSRMDNGKVLLALYRGNILLAMWHQHKGHGMREQQGRIFADYAHVDEWQMYNIWIKITSLGQL
jgi:hypothetical protein